LCDIHGKGPAREGRWGDISEIYFEVAVECAGALVDSNRSTDERHTLSCCAMLGLLFQIGVLAAMTFLVWRWFEGKGAQQVVTQAATLRPEEDEVSPLKDYNKVMMMSFICSCKNKIGTELHIYLEEGTYHKRLFKWPSTNDMKKK